MEFLGAVVFWYLVFFTIVCAGFAWIGIRRVIADELAIRRYMKRTGMPRDVALKNVPLFLPTE